MDDGLRIARVRLAAPADALAALANWYGDRLGLRCERTAGGVAAPIGPDELAFVAADDGRPFYHFALLVPGDRFDAAYAWLGERAELLAREDGETVFDFSFWDALACYAADPAGNIVELIAHHGVAERGASGAFSAEELAGISEIGLVLPDPVVAVERLQDELQLDPWSGDAASGLGFVGRRAHTLIVSRTGRGWLPTGRPAEVHPVHVTLTATPGGEADLSADGREIVVRAAG